ncbi:MAG: M48 family metallopeptidase [Bacteroidales bacterium]
MMKKVTFLFVLLIAGVVFSCSIVPFTGRKQLSIVPESEMIAMGLASYQEFMKENPVSPDKINGKIVKEVGTRLSTAVDFFFAANNMETRLDGYKWEYSLVESTVPNAFCIPGGKVVIYSGILPYTKDKNGLAVVISHEIAHAVARHGGERMSQQLLLQFGGVALGEAVKNKPEETKSIYNTVYGIGAQLGVVLPYSREHEYEADKIGLIFMALAGYDPQGAVIFWDRMSKIGGNKPLEFLSTHPTDAKRISKIKAAMPEVMQYYKK